MYRMNPGVSKTNHDGNTSAGGSCNSVVNVYSYQTCHAVGP